MKAVCWYGAEDVRVESVPAPKILNTHDAIVRVTSASICGSDLHIYDGCLPAMEKGDILGHEFMGEVVEVGSGVRSLKAGDRVVVPFTICCGECYFCKNRMWSLCDNSNPDSTLAEKFFGDTGAGMFGYSHVYGGFAGGQAEYARVPFADVIALKVNGNLSDEKLLFLSDVLPAGYQAAENCQIQPGDVVAVWGCGPVGQFAIQSARLLGASRVIALDPIPFRLEMARIHGKAEVLNRGHIDVGECLREMTGGRGPDACIDAVGMEAHGAGMDALYDRAKQAARLETDRAYALRQAIQACRKGGVVSVAGVYAGSIDRFPIGAAFAKGLTLRMGQTHVLRYMQPLLERIQQGQIDPSFIVTHRMNLDDAPEAYRIFRHSPETCLNVVLRP